MQERLTKTELMRRERTFNIMKDLYELQALTTEQLSRRFNYSIRYMGRLIRRLRADNLIISEKVKGYRKKNRQQGNYHRITTKGIRLLNQADFSTSRSADQLRVSDYHLAYVLSANDLVIDLEPFGWKFMNSRDTKRKKELNRGDNIHGTLFSPEGKEYGFYIFIGEVTPKNMAKIKKEVSRNGQTFSNIIIFAKTPSIFKKVIDEFYNSTDIVSYFAFRIFPYEFAKNYLITLDYEDNLMDFIRIFDIDYFPEAKIDNAPMGLDAVVMHEGEEKYFVNMLDNDLTKLHPIINYRKERYELDGRRVLVVTNMDDIYRDILKDIHHVDFVDITRTELTDYFYNFKF